jgi:ubiquinone/menaquinone biosynthesis C-methylase UbiE
VPTDSDDALDQVRAYYRKKESRWGYRLFFSGVRHFGYYPTEAPGITMREAQRNMEDVVGQALQLPPGSLVLDAGCGEGSTARRLATKFDLRVDGVDLLAESVSLAKKRSHERGLSDRVSFSEGDFTYVPAKDRRYDGVYTVEALIHAPDLGRAMNEFYRVLKPGGALVLAEYSKPPTSDLSAKEQQTFSSISSRAGMHSFDHFIHGAFPSILSDARFEALSVTDLTPNILPMLKRFHHIAVAPHWVLTRLGLTETLVNAYAAVEGYRLRDKFRYNLIAGKSMIESKDVGPEVAPQI